MKNFLIKLKDKILTVRGIKVVISILLAIACYFTAIVNLGASLAVLAFILGLWLDEVIEITFKVIKSIKEV